MPFLREEDIKPATKDLISWYFDEPAFKIFVDALDPSNHHTGHTAKATIRKLVAGLYAAGFKPGDVACLHSFNDINYPVIVNGIVGAGGIFAGTNPSYTVYELSHTISTANVSWFIVEPELLPKVIEACGKANISTDRIFIFDNAHNNKTVPSDLRSWRWLLEQGEQDWIRFDSEQRSRDTIVSRLFSSGTTGLPKAAQHTQWNYKAQHAQTQEWRPKPYEICFSSLRNGITNYIMRRFDLETLLRCIERYRITDVMLVPPVVNTIVHSKLTAKYSLKSIRMLLGAGAPLDQSLQAKMQALLPPGSQFIQSWAMTESTCICTTIVYPNGDTTGSVGWPVPGLDIKLVDEDGNDISAYDTRGEMCVRGDNVIGGYFNNSKANEDWDADGYFHTGDIMYCDGKTRKWYVVDRRKELIKVRAFQVAPSELEAVLISHPSIEDAAVIGVKSTVDVTELPRAYIVKRSTQEGQALGENEINAYMAEKLAKYKQLEGGIVFTDQIAKNASGKILKRLYRERAAKEMASKL